MEPRLLPYAERQAPRYTSYPSASYFGPEVDAAVHRTWLRALPADASLSLYIYVPYCKRICWYCGCNTNAAHPGDTADFTETVLKEIDLVAAAAGSHCVDEIHWGGGTPNILSARQFKQILHHLDFWFDLAQPLAHSVEIDPRSLSEDLATTYAACGVNRASLGVQTFASHVQHVIGRDQPFDQVAHAVSLLRSVGVSHISFDLMYGLPGQSLLDVLETIELAVRLKPDRIALFEYSHVPWLKRRQRVIDETTLPNARDRYDHALAARRALLKRGYVAIGMDHFAKPDDPLALATAGGALHRSLQGYAASAPGAIIGFGPSAISTTPQGYVQNLSGVGAWRRAIGAERLASARGHALTAEDERRRWLIERLMCDFAVNLQPLGGRGAFMHELDLLSPLAADGLVVINDDQLVIPEAMRPFCPLVAQAFDAYQGGARHPSAA